MFTWLLSTIVLVLSIYSHFNHGQDPKHCDGNYISPSYSSISLVESTPIATPIITSNRYTLKRHYEFKNVDQGYPVLFLVGNAGSYGQARSFGAVAHRVYNWNGKRHLPVQLYTIDTHSELSAFNSMAVQDQAIFANECIKTILATYKEEYQPKYFAINKICFSYWTQYGWLRWLSICRFISR